VCIYDILHSLQEQKSLGLGGGANLKESGARCEQPASNGSSCDMEGKHFYLRDTARGISVVREVQLLSRRTELRCLASEEGVPGDVFHFEFLFASRRVMR
jgi:hypothetical protein